jgi:hypothetical protein
VKAPDMNIILLVLKFKNEYYEKFFDYNSGVISGITGLFPG